MRIMLRVLVVWAALVLPIAHAEDAAGGDFTDPMFRSSLETSTCPNGITEDSEQCDDNNGTVGDNCAANCRLFNCGDMNLDAPFENCDDGDNDSGDGCDGRFCFSESGWTCNGVGSASCVTTCGDGQVVGTEQCDDANTNPGDGCNATCAVEPEFECSGQPSVCVFPGTNETEPNDDTSPNQNGGNGNDFANGFCENATTSCNVANAAQNCAGIGAGTCTAHNSAGSVLATGNFNVSAGTQLIAAALSPAGDEDTYRVVNDTASPVVLTAESFGPGGVGTCVAVDTEINIRDAAGAELANDDESGVGNCSLEAWALAPGDTRFVHVIDFLDNSTVSRYFLQLRFQVTVCGNGVIELGEQCDQGGGNVINGDGCSSVCAVEPGFACTGVPSVCVLTLSESEPNDDTIRNINGGNGNDFANGFCENATTACNVANAAQNCAGIGGGTCIAHGVIASVVANGSYNVSAGTQTIAAALTPAGDEDTFRVVNDTIVPVTLTAETFGPGGVGTCVGVDTEINIRDVAGSELANDDQSGISSCSLATFVLNPGDTRFVHVIDWVDDTAVASYFLQLRFQ